MSENTQGFPGTEPEVETTTSIPTTNRRPRKEGAIKRTLNRTADLADNSIEFVEEFLALGTDTLRLTRGVLAQQMIETKVDTYEDLVNRGLDAEYIEKVMAKFPY